MFMKRMDYLPPVLCENLVAVEAGFAASASNDDWGLPGEDAKTNDYGEF